MRITTWNVNSLRVRLPHVLRFAEEQAPDVLCLQELKLSQDAFPEEELRAVFPHLEWWGQPTYNGVALLSKQPLEDVRRGFEGWKDDEARVLSCLVGGVRLWCLYTPNGQAIGTPKFLYKLEWLRHLREDLDRFASGTDVVVVGDMNVAPDDLDLWDPFKLDGQILCHPDERAALQHVLDWGLLDAFREQNPYANEFSWWDYQKMGFQRNHGLRIDHTFVSRHLMPTVGRVTIHRDVRGWDNPSDHAPVSLDLKR
ncbi:MAG: exodeoxyribonuclease III [Myxococcales bacterium]|nr:exodeoxyribonuclease III [Myxococcales bacterium]